MDLLASGLMTALSFIGPFLLVLTVIVFFHELGHFLVARWCGVAVETFSIGFGKELVGWNDSKGTRWKISLLPLGGYVKFLGDYGASSVPDRAQLEELSQRADEGGFNTSQCFHFKPLWQRSAVVVAGPLANFLLAIVVYAGFFMFIGERNVAPYVGTVVEGSAAEEAGFLPNDLIVAVDGRQIKGFSDLQSLIILSSGTERLITVERTGQKLDLVVVPRRTESEDAFGNKQKLGRLGINARLAEEDMSFRRYSPLTALWRGTQRTGFIIEQSLVYIGRLFTGREDARNLGGPIKIAQFSGQAAQISLLAVIQVIAILSVSVGLINLFPIPMLDGGHLLFYGFEAALGKPLSERTQEYGFRIGLSLVLVLMIYVTWNDINNIHAIEKLTGLLS